MRVSVLGGGHGCYVVAAELSEHGHEVWLWRRKAADFAAITEQGGIEVRDHRGTRVVSIARWAGCAASVAKGLSAVASAITNEDLFAQGRTLEQLGLAGFDRAPMTRYLHDGR